jgi:hypothetical protein
MINELKNIVGAENVLDDQETLELYSGDQSLAQARKPLAVVKVKNTEEVQKVVKLANEKLIPITPSSSGIHFTGASLPSQGGIVMDLSGMNKILEIDTRNRKVKIEPGVTWQQLQEALKEHDQIPLNPLFPHPKTSALTSTIEREPMLIPKYEYGDPILPMEVVLPTGDIFKTGTASDSHTQGAYPEGPGIDFYRFFVGAQGTMGIITWLNMKTEYRPQKQKAFFVAFNDLEEAADPIYQIQRKLIGNECFVLSRLLLASLLCEEDGDEFEKLMEDLPPYTLCIIIAGAVRRPLERIEYEEEALMEIAANLNFQVKKTVGGVSGLGTTMIDKLRNLPSDENYWKTTFENSTQDVFFTTTMDRAQDFTDTALGYATTYGLSIEEIGIYMQPLERGRACHLSFSFPCDLENEQEKESIGELCNELCKDLINDGAFFTRPYGPLADLVYSKATGYATMLKELKKVFDPKGILNPGKLCH